MFRLGITGGIGMGKSTAAEILLARGYRVVDTDSIARDLVAPGQPALDAIRQHFGPEVIRPDGTLDRARLAAVVFGDSAKRETLEGILHPRIRAEWLRRLAAWNAEGETLGAVVIPLLFETAAEPEFDAVACVACSAPSQLERLRHRGWSEADIRRRIDAQLPIAEKLRRADLVVWTEVPRAEHEEQWRRIVAGCRRPDRRPVARAGS